MTKTKNLLKLALAVVLLALVVPPVAGKLGSQLNVPTYKLAVFWKGNPLKAPPKPMAISYVVGSTHRDVVGNGGHWSTTGMARRNEHVVVVGVAADRDALSRCEIWLDEERIDKDPDVPDGMIIDGERWVNGQVFCEAWMPEWP